MGWEDGEDYVLICVCVWEGVHGFGSVVSVTLCVCVCVCLSVCVCDSVCWGEGGGEGDYLTFDV